jgi:hypothetical protein
MVLSALGSMLRRRFLLGLFWLASVLLWGAVLQRPTPLFVNLGAGDAAFAHGFRADWERDGLRGGGETMFHWTEDGARLGVPVQVLSGRPVARLRLARFAPNEAQITLLSGERVIDRWTQPPRGWDIREVTLGAVHGPIALQFRSEASGNDPLGVGPASSAGRSAFPYCSVSRSDSKARSACRRSLSASPRSGCTSIVWVDLLRPRPQGSLPVS